MGRSPREVPSPSPLPPAIVRLVAARGGDAAVLALRGGLPDDVAARDEVPIGPLALEELLDAAATLLGAPHLALELPAALPFRRYGLHELAARAAATTREALERMARYASLAHPRLELVLEEDGDEARWRQRLRGLPRGTGRHTHEYALASLLTHVARATGRTLPVRRVWFMHARPRDLAPLYRFFGTRELDFGAADNGVAFDRAALDWPTRDGDARLLATVEPLAEAALRAQPPVRDFADEVAARIRALLPDGGNVDAVAAALHMSARTLQRRLGDAGTQFSEVLDQVRSDEARRLLADPALPLGEIAWRLGFADLATFSRAFKRWTGKPPGTFRRGG